MKKGQRRLLLVLLSALMVFFVCGITAYADDEVIGLRTSTHKIVITNNSGGEIYVTGTNGPGAFTWHQDVGVTEPYITPDVLTCIYSNDILTFASTIPNYEISASYLEGYKYCLSFIDEEEYTGDLNLDLRRDADAILLSFNANDGTDLTSYWVEYSKKKFCLPDSDFYERDGYELVGWQKGKKTYEPGAEVKFKDDSSFDAVWQHVHKWSLEKTGSNTAELQCLNEGCEWEGPATLTFEAENKLYSEDGYDVAQNTTILLGGDIPIEVVADAVCTGDTVATHLGRKVELPKDVGKYKATVTLSLYEDPDEQIKLTDSFSIRRAGNLRLPYLDPPIIEGWTEFDKPNKPDLSWTKAKKPLVLYSDAESLGKISNVIGKLINKEEDITIDDFKELKGAKVSLIPPARAGEYIILVIGVTKNYYDIGINNFTVGVRTGVLETAVGSWTYGEYDQSVNGPVATIDGINVTDSAEFSYKPLISSKDEEYVVFDPETAADIDAGIYLLKTEVIDNSGDEGELKETYSIFKVSKAYAEATAPVGVEGLVADGEEHELVTPGTCDYGTFAYLVCQRGGSDDDAAIITYDTPTASEAGTYYVRYRLFTDSNHYSSVKVKRGRIKVKIFPAPEPADEPVVEPETGDDVQPGDEQPGGDVQPGSDVQPGADVDPPATDNTGDNAQADQKDRKLPVISAKAPSAGKTSVKARWNKLSRKSRSKCDGIEVMVASDKKFTSDCVTAFAKSKKATSCKIGSLDRKTTYYVKVRTYKYRDGVRYVGKWSKVKKVRTR